MQDCPSDKKDVKTPFFHSENQEQEIIDSVMICIT